MWDRFDRWFDKHKYGVIGTLLLHTFALLGMSAAQLRGRTEQVERNKNAVEVAPPMTEQELEQLIAYNENPEAFRQPVTNAISNVTAEMARPSEAVLQRYESATFEELKELERQEFDRLAQERAERGEEIVIPDLTPEKWDKKLYMEPAKPVRLSGNVTVEHNLTGRSADIRVPAYKCKTGGVVFVDVEVEADGRVDRAEVNEGASSTTDACMTELAVEAALQARFSPLAGDGGSQRGWIKFTFVAQ